MTSADDPTVAYFNQIAESWHRLSALPPAAAAAVLTALDIKAGQRVLDVGCGTGLLFAPLLARLGPAETSDPGCLVGLDPARRMLAIAARAHRGETRLRLVCAALAGYNGDDGPFDAILACRVLPHLPDPGHAVGRLLDWLRPGGRLVICETWDENTAAPTPGTTLPPPPGGWVCQPAATGSHWGVWMYRRPGPDL